MKNLGRSLREVFLRSAAAALYAWLCQRIAWATDYVIAGAMARLGGPMGWREVERFARARAEEDWQLASEILHEQNEAGYKMTQDLEKILTEEIRRKLSDMRRTPAVRKSLYDMGLIERPDLRLLGKP